MNDQISLFVLSSKWCSKLKLGLKDSVVVVDDVKIVEVSIYLFF